MCYPTEKDLKGKIRIIILLLVYLIIMGSTYSQIKRDYVYRLKRTYVQLKDTIFQYEVYFQENGYIDSIVCKNKSIRLSKTKWIECSELSTSYCVQKFRRVRHSSWFKENNGILFQADFEVKLYASTWFHSDGTIFKYRQIGPFYYTKEYKGKVPHVTK